MSASRDTGSSAAVLWAAGILGDVQWKQLPLRCGVLARNQSNCEQGTKEQCHRNIECERGSLKFLSHGFLLPGKNLQWKPSIRSQVSQVTNDDKLFYGMGH